MKVDDYIYLLIACFAAGTGLAWHLDRKNKFNLLDLVCTDGRLNDKKAVRFGSWVVMTIGFYTLAMHHPEQLVAYAPLYGGLWVSAAALDKWQRQQGEPK